MQASAEKTWNAAQEHLRTMLSPDTYNLWFAPLKACGQEDNSLVLEVANEFCEVWLVENYLDLLKDVVAISSGQRMQITFRVASGSVGPVTTATALEPALGKTKMPMPPLTAVRRQTTWV